MADLFDLLVAETEDADGVVRHLVCVEELDLHVVIGDLLLLLFGPVLVTLPLL